jgi:hypothetical protein
MFSRLHIQIRVKVHHESDTRFMNNTHGYYHHGFTKCGVLLRVEIPKLISTMRFIILYLKDKANEIS